ncbi:MAG: response regulator [Chitinophagaceae bacterium]|nr:response regulator [Chitinophagaceae bacterium]
MLQELEILLVEDNMADAELTIRALNKAKIANSILHLKDGAEAIDYLFGRGVYAERDISKLPRVILLDIKMPKVDGIEVLRQLKASERTKVIPVVMMTSSSEEKDIVSSYELGVNSYVVKPVGFEDFAKAVAELGLYWMLLNKPVNNL